MLKCGIAWVDSFGRDCNIYIDWCFKCQLPRKFVKLKSLLIVLVGLIRSKDEKYVISHLVIGQGNALESKASTLDLHNGIESNATILYKGRKQECIRAVKDLFVLVGGETKPSFANEFT